MCVCRQTSPVEVTPWQRNGAGDARLAMVRVHNSHGTCNQSGTHCKSQTITSTIEHNNSWSFTAYLAAAGGDGPLGEIIAMTMW